MPLLSYITTNLLGRLVGITGSCILATSAIFSSFALALFAFIEVALYDSIVILKLFNWLDIELLVSSWSFLFDTLSVIMLMVVTGVSSLVHLYSIEYMHGDPNQGRFMGYLSLFTFFMLVLVTADNFLVMFFGWEGIGLASFLLISFWSNRIQAGKSAIKAMLVNRIGDVGLSLGICAIFLEFKSIDYTIVFSLTPLVVDSSVSFLCFELDKLSIITFLLFWGALGKSAQIGLHLWLPDAMEGPTPVSALIHAATLVTAGIFLIIRCSILFENSYTSLTIVSIFGSVTAFFAASVGLVQNDLKRVIAYSTCSQLGYMAFACGLSHYSVALFHLANHALFKALLFLSAGCVIHGIQDEQDLRRMGGLVRLLPLSYTMIMIGSLALVGFPFLTGFYSKDAILEIALVTPCFIGNFSHWLGCLAALFTSFYSFRLMFLAFINQANGYKTYIEEVHDAPIKMILPLVLLGFGSIFWGFISRDLFIGLGSSFFGSSIFIFQDNWLLIDSEFSLAILKNIPLMFTILGLILSFLLINCTITSKHAIFSYKIGWLYRSIFIFLSKKWHLDQIANSIVTIKAMNFGYRASFQIADKGAIETFGPYGVAINILRTAKNLVGFHSGYVFHYSLVMIFSISFLFSYLIHFNGSIDSITFVVLIASYAYFIIQES